MARLCRPTLPFRGFSEEKLRREAPTPRVPWSPAGPKHHNQKINRPPAGQKNSKPKNSPASAPHIIENKYATRCLLECADVLRFIMPHLHATLHADCVIIVLFTKRTLVFISKATDPENLIEKTVRHALVQHFIICYILIDCVVTQAPWQHGHNIPI